MTLVVNLVAGPGAGKSTTAAATFAELKQSGVNCELVTEYAKDQVWGENLAVLGNQIYLFGKQYHRLWRLLGKVDVIVTDSPLFLFMYYGAKQSETYRSLVFETFNSMDNMTILLRRVKAFNPAGRVQTEDKAREIDQVLNRLIHEHEVPFFDVDADTDAGRTIARQVLAQLKEVSSVLGRETRDVT